MNNLTGHLRFPLEEQGLIELDYMDISQKEVIKLWILVKTTMAKLNLKQEPPAHNQIYSGHYHVWTEKYGFINVDFRKKTIIDILKEYQKLKAEFKSSELPFYE